MTGSATRVRQGSTQSAYLARMSMPWQYRALQYYDQIGELHFASHFLARMMSRVRLPSLRSAIGTD